MCRPGASSSPSTRQCSSSSTRRSSSTAKSLLPTLPRLERGELARDRAEPDLAGRQRPASTRASGRPASAELPTPDFDGLPIDRYLRARAAPPLAMARGCYFGKCAFCNVGYGEAEVFSQLKSEPLLDQMRRLTARHGSRRVFFVDEAMPPRLIRDLAPALEALGTPIRWGGCMRFREGDRPGPARHGAARRLRDGALRPRVGLAEGHGRHDQGHPAAGHRPGTAREPRGRDLEPHVLLLRLPERDGRGRAGDGRLRLGARRLHQLGRDGHVPARAPRAGAHDAEAVRHQPRDRAPRCRPAVLLRLRGRDRRRRRDGRADREGCRAVAAAEAVPAVLRLGRLPLPVRDPPRRAAARLPPGSARPSPTAGRRPPERCPCRDDGGRDSTTARDPPLASRFGSRSSAPAARSSRSGWSGTSA